MIERGELPGRQAGRCAGQKRKNARGGRRKPLTTLDPDKGVKGNPSLFLG